MRVFAISDLHLPGGDDKPMDVFGSHWEDHFAKIRQDWMSRVREEDLVLIAGDISWAMQLGQARADLEAIGQLPGQKAILRGNHDYWWSTLTQVRAALPSSIRALQNDCLCYEELVVCGSRGWIPMPSGGVLGPEDQKIHDREVMRMTLSLESGRRLAQGRPLVAMMHYPPMNDRWEPSPFTRLFESYGVERVVYGHLHGGSIRSAFNGEKGGVMYQLTSCDALDFSLCEWPPRELKG